MPQANFNILYVASPLESAGFYQRLLGTEPVESSPGFAMFALPTGAMLGLWAKHDVQPPATAAGGSELGFTADSREAVDQCHAQWQAAGVPIVQAPVQMDFGYTFTAIDPDGHRLRVFAPGGQ